MRFGAVRLDRHTPKRGLAMTIIYGVGDRSGKRARCLYYGEPSQRYRLYWGYVELDPTGLAAPRGCGFGIYQLA